MNKQTPIEPASAIAALAKAQSEMGVALKKTNNPHFKSKYADLSSVQDACFDALHNNGFAVVQPSGRDESGMFVDTLFLHTSGETFQSRVYLVVDKNNMQGVGSAITYARRYGLMGLAGIAPEDDDGNAAAKAPPQPNPASEGLAQAWDDGIMDSLPPDPSPETLAEAYAETMLAEIEAYKQLKALVGYYNRHKVHLDFVQEHLPQAHAGIMSAFGRKKTELTPQKDAA